MQSQINVLDKKKRTSTSGSRSKSKKSTNYVKNDQTVELKPKNSHIFQNQDICTKIKTENSLSVNKSKGSRKNSKSFKKPIKGSIKQSKDQSYLASAQRKYSVNRINKSQNCHLQSQDIFKKLHSIKKQLKKMQLPQNYSIHQTEVYFNQIKQSLATISIQPLDSILLQLHSMYIEPVQKIFNMIKPYEKMLRRKQEISMLIRDQIEENQKLYRQLDPEDIEIIKLKQKINKNSELIQQMRKKKKLSQNQFSMKKQKKKQKSPNGESQQVEFLDLSKQNQDVLGKGDQSFQRKLYQQYDKAPRFNEQKRNNNFISNSNEKINNPFSQALKEHEHHHSDLKKIVSQQKYSNLPSQGQQSRRLEGYQDELDQMNQQQYHQQKANKQLAHVQQKHNKIGNKAGGMTFNFKLDIPKIDKGSVGFHDQFYSKLDQFSQSWRNQALRQKRF